MGRDSLPSMIKWLWKRAGDDALHEWIEDLRKAIEALPEVGRQEVVLTLTQALESSGEQRAEYWRNRIFSFWRTIWPQSRAYKTQALAEPIARLCIAAGEVFPEAFKVLQPWMQPFRDSDLVVDLLEQGKLCSSYPADALEFLSTVVDTHASWSPIKLAICLNDIEAASSGLREDRRFRCLTEFLRRYS